MMPQGLLPFQLVSEASLPGLTALGGLPLYLDLAHVAGLRDSIMRRVRARNGDQGWTDAQTVMALMLMQLAGGDSVDDLRVLEGDEGFNRILQRVELHGLPRQKRRAQQRRWRKARRRSVPSSSAVFRYLRKFHDPEQERLREELRETQRAFIPAPKPELLGLRGVNQDLVGFVQRCSPQSQATLDIDATVLASEKREALYCYKHYKSYQPLNVYWAEQEMVVHSEFRDGNVPAGYQIDRVLAEALSHLPDGVERVYLRSDTAGYDHRLLRYCAEGRSGRFGVIEFAVGADVTPAFKEAVAQVQEDQWHPLYRWVEGRRIKTDQEWAEVCFVPNWVAQGRREGPEYRFVAIREPLRQLDLSGLETSQRSFPFPVMEFAERGRYKVFGIVTNRTLGGEELIWWYRERCGKSEAVHSEMKHDLAGGKLPSGLFGANAAWWAIMILALNLNTALKRLVLGGEWVTKRLKAIRYAIIHMPARVVRHARYWWIHLSGRHPSSRVLLEARERLGILARGSPS
jgi:hypothetical protein